MNSIDLSAMETVDAMARLVKAGPHLGGTPRRQYGECLDRMGSCLSESIATTHLKRSWPKTAFIVNHTA